MSVQTLKRLLPGLAFAVLFSIPAWFLGKAVPVIGGPVFAILIGMAVALFRRSSRAPHALFECTAPGLQYTGKKILQYAVILLGFGLNLSEILRVGKASLLIIICTISVSLLLSYFLFKVLKLEAKTATLIGVGSSICGGSAIAATAPVIDANEDEIAQAMSVIFLFNVLAALIFPTLGGLLGMSNEGFGLFAGTAVNDTSSVTAAASSWDAIHHSSTLGIATIVKLTRTLAILPITLVLAFWTNRKQMEEDQKNHIKLHRIFPFFILYFLLASIVTTVLPLVHAPEWILHLLKFLSKDVSKFFIVMAMFSIGSKTDVVELVRTGAKPILQGLLCWIAIALTSVGMQLLQGLW